MTSICRLCATLKKVENFQNLRDPKLNLCKKLEKCCQLYISEDNLPQIVCLNCIQCLEDSWTFYLKVNEAQESLMLLFDIESNDSVSDRINTNSTNNGKVKDKTIKDVNFVERQQRQQRQQHELEKNTNLNQLNQKNNMNQLSANDKRILNENENVEIIIETETTTEQSTFLTTPSPYMSSSSAGNNQQRQREQQQQHKKIDADSTYCYRVEEQQEVNNDYDYVYENDDNDDNDKDDNTQEIHHIVTCSEDDFMIAVNEVTNNDDNDVNDNDNDASNENKDEDKYKNHKDYLLKNYYYYKYDNDNYVDKVDDEVYQQEEGYNPDMENFSNASENSTDEVELLEIIDESEAITTDDDNGGNDNDNDNHNHNHNKNIKTWKDYLWKCNDCDNLYFENHLNLYNHVKLVHSIDEQIIKTISYYCIDCKKIFTKYYVFINHVKFRHRKNLLLCCDICNEIHENYVKLSDHRKTEHSLFLSISSPQSSSSLTTTAAAAAKINQMKSFEEINLVICSKCGKAFKNSQSLQVHMNCHKPREIRFKFACETCNKKFASKTNMIVHQKIHSGLKEFVCDQCGKDFVQKVNLEEHLIRHMNYFPYECDECKKRFKTSARLAKHKTVHTDVKSYKCQICNRLFRERDTLKVHNRIHTGVLPFTCEYCGKKFRTASVLVTHRRLHTGVRPYSCTDCDHHFTNWPNYNKHMKRIHGIDTSSRKK